MSRLPKIANPQRKPYPSDLSDGEWEILKPLQPGPFARAVKQVCGSHVRVEVLQRTSKTFERLPKRWIVERTFGWLNRFRRLSKDYELYTEISEAMIYGSLIRLMLKRLVF